MGVVCSACLFSNLAHARFCESCGSQLTSTCPSCGASADHGKRFCGDCGHEIDPGAAAGLDGPVGEADLRPVAVVAIHGLRPAAKDDPSQGWLVEQAELLEARLVTNADGVLLVLFGIPRTVEDHCRRAVMFALAVRDHANSGDWAAQLSIGIAAGNVSSPGDDVSLIDPTLAGTAIAIATHSEGAAVLVDSTTARHVRGSIQFEPFSAADSAIRDEDQLIGDHIPLFAAEGDLNPSRAGRRRHDGPLSPFVGRSREVLLLTAALSDVIENGAGQVIGIVGEAGMGKSRLLEEFRQLSRTSAQWLEGRCLSFGGSRPYLPILDVVHDLAGTSGSDSVALVRRQVRDCTRDAGLGEHQSNLILDLLDTLDSDRRDIDGLSPEAVNEQTSDALRHLLLAAAQRRPLVLVIEDVHWSDETSLNFLTTLATAVAGVPLMMITTFRPGTRPGWLDLSYAAQLALSRLGPADSLQVVRTVSERDNMPEDLGRAILARADGNPFFLEELALAITDSTGISEAGVPDTVQGVIFARIDRLPEVTRRVLQTASVLGREFSSRLLEAVWAGPGSPREHLELLCREEFLIKATIEGLPGFMFKHALTQDVAYQSLPATRRRSLHEAAGLSLEESYAGRVDEAYELLAHHWAQTDDSPRAIGYLRRTAETSARRYAHHEASVALREALRHAALLPDDDRVVQVTELTLRLVQSLYFIGHMTESASELDQIAPIVDTISDRQLVGSFHFWVAHTASHLGEHAQASQAAHLALEKARACDDQAGVGRSLYVLCREGWWTGAFRDGIAHGQAAIPLLSGAGDYWWLGHCHFFVAHSSYSLGDFGSALAAAVRGGAIGDAVADPRLRSWAAWAEGLYEAARGNTDLGVARCREGVELSPDGANTAWALGALGFAKREGGDLVGAIGDLEHAIELARSTQHPGILCRFQGWLAEALLRAADLDRAEASARTAFLLASESGCRWVAGLARRTQGRLAAERGDFTSARRLLIDARARLQALECRFDLALTYMDLAANDRRSGRDPEDSIGVAQGLLRDLDAPIYSDRLRSLAVELGIRHPEAAGTPRLTTREREVLALITEGLSNKQIAERLVISQGTVIRHVANIFAKLGVNNRTAAARAAASLSLT